MCLFVDKELTEKAKNRDQNGFVIRYKVLDKVFSELHSPSNGNVNKVEDRGQ